MTGRSALLVRSQIRPGVVAALVHRVSGLALSFFLPAHFLALGLAIRGADVLQNFLSVTANPWVKAAEVAMVISLSVHLACGMRLLAIEFLALRDRTAVTVSLCFGFALVCGLLFLLNVQVGRA